MVLPFPYTAFLAFFAAIKLLINAAIAIILLTMQARNKYFFGPQSDTFINRLMQIISNKNVSATTTCDTILFEFATPFCNIKNNKPNAAGISAVGACVPSGVSTAKYPYSPAARSTIAFKTFADAAFIYLFFMTVKI